MKTWILAATTLALATAAPLAAQTPNFGLGLILGVPTGALNSSSYPDGQNETYNSSLGGQFTVSWPVQQALALRLNLSGIAFDGTGSAPGFYNWNVQDSVFSIGGEAELFLPDGNVERHLGSYLIGGLHSDFEHFSASNFDPSYAAFTSVDKTRLAATVGFGHTFRGYGRTHWTLEAAYHKTLTGTDSNDSAGLGFPASDYLKFYAGIAF